MARFFEREEVSTLPVREVGAVMSRPFLAALLALTLLAADPVSAPSDPTLLLALRGKSAAALTFVPFDGPPQPLVQPGKPTVVIAFASWCEPCIQELPRVLADYARFKDRVNFAGIDFLDAEQAGRSVVARYAIPFPVEHFGDESMGQSVTIDALQATEARCRCVPSQKTAFTATELDTILPLLKRALFPETFARLVPVLKRGVDVTPRELTALAAEHGVAITVGIGKITTSPVDNPLALPHAFIIDDRGIVRNEVIGYSQSVDPIADALITLGIR